MTGLLRILRAGPSLSVQDLGRAGLMAQGLSRGGAADRLALLEAQALLGLSAPAPAIEMAGLGGIFEVTAPTRIALTGGAMKARVGEASLEWNATHLLRPGERLEISGAVTGSYGYLTLAGGLESASWLGSRAAHFSAGLGQRLVAGDEIACGADPSPEAPPLRLTPEARFSGGDIRLMPGPQTALFDVATRARFCATTFRRSPASNRQGIAFDHDGAPFEARAARALASDFIVPGDIQMTGRGAPMALLAECQTIGGYPRIGTVISADLPRLAQAPVGSALRFTMLDLETADALLQTPDALLANLRAATSPRVRSPHDIADLLSYQLIDGMTPGDDLERQ